MTLMQFNWKPSNKHLRQFGLIAAVAFPTLGWLWGGSVSTITTFAVVGVILAILGLIVPRLLAPIFIGLMILAAPFGFVFGELSILLIYYGCVVPLGAVFHLIKRDSLNRTIDSSADSYWQTKKQPKSLRSYYRQS